MVFGIAKFTSFLVLDGDTPADILAQGYFTCMTRNAGADASIEPSSRGRKSGREGK